MSRHFGLSCVAIAGCLLWTSSAEAHPGVGIVMDSRGNVYYTDLKKVWRIALDGKKSVVVPGVHTHELCLDAQDNLYGEHLWYEGERTDKWGHYVWRRSPDGRVEKIFGPREGFLPQYGYSFVRDDAGNMYWTERDAASNALTRIRKRSPDGKITDVASAAFNNVRWMTASPDGTVYLVDFRGGWESHLVRISSDGKVFTLTKDLSEFRLSIFGINDQHAVMGLAVDGNGNVYAAVAGNRVVKKVTPAGHVSVVARGESGWTPTGVLPRPDGVLWVLEGSSLNAVRVRRIRPDGSSTTF
jgi:DNA-binding beta-propeller fold protein YncE